jgi:serine-type D-Ala-D-Ala carboxypeptidase
LRDLAETPSSQTVRDLEPALLQRLEKLIDSHLDGTFPAAAMTVVHRGTVRLNAAWGWIDPDTRNLPTPPHALFDLASVSKLFTATAFLSLASGGRVALQEALATVIPEFGESGPRPIEGGQDPHTRARFPAPPEARGRTVDPRLVTFFHLLTHTSGLAPWRDVFTAAGPPPPPPDRYDPIPRAERWRRTLSALCRYPFAGTPGDGVIRYSDLGLMLLGEAVGRRHGVSGGLEDAIRERVCLPLSLESVTFNPLVPGRDRRTIVPTEEDRSWRRRRCWGEVHDENACGAGGVAGHAGLFGTARDVAALGQAWLDADHRLGIAPDLGAAATREQAVTTDLRYGLGWMLKAPQGSSAGDRFGPDSFGHTGFTGTSLWIDPARRLVVALLTNRVYPGRHREGIHAFRRAVHDLVAGGVL